MFCSNCGTKKSPDGKFCPNCGQAQTIRNSTNIINPTPVVPKKRFNKLLLIMPILIIFIIGVMMIFSSHQSPSGSINLTGTRTIMIYMVGTDLESKNGAATADLKEMINAQLNDDDLNIIVYAGGTKTWTNDFKNNTIYELTKSGFKEVKTFNAKSMADPETLIDFLDYTAANYQTDLYDLIFWNHGAGPIMGYGFDELNNNDSLSLNDINMALKSSALTQNNKLEFIGFDACLMATVEVASVLNKYAYYLIASQDVEPGYGWEYNFLSTVNRETTSTDLGKKIIDSFYNTYVTYGLDKYWSLTLSLVDLTKIRSVENTIDGLFADVELSLDQGGYSTIVNQMTKPKCFQCDGYDNSYDLIDLYGAALELKNSYNNKADALIKALDTAVLYQRSNVNGAYGLSIYYPYYTKRLLTQWLNVYNNLDFATEYKSFLNSYTRTLMGERIAEFDFKKSFPEISAGGDDLSVKLDAEVIQNYHKSKYIIFKDMKDGYYSPVYSSTDTTLQADGTLVANFKKEELNIHAGKDTHPVISSEYERTKDYVIYQTMVTLWYGGSGIPIGEWKNGSANILLKVDAKNPNGKIIGAVPVVDIEDPKKETVNLTDWTTIQFWNFRYKIFDKNGKFTWDWISAASDGGSVSGYEVFTNEAYSLKFDSLDPTYDYYCLFLIQDTQGYQYTTNPVKLNK